MSRWFCKFYISYATKTLESSFCCISLKKKYINQNLKTNIKSQLYIFFGIQLHVVVVAFQTWVVVLL